MICGVIYDHNFTNNYDNIFERVVVLKMPKKNEEFAQREQEIEKEVNSLFLLGLGIPETFRRLPAMYESDPQRAVDFLFKVINRAREQFGLPAIEESYIIDGYRFSGMTEEHIEFCSKMYHTTSQEIALNEIKNADFVEFYKRDPIIALGYLQNAYGIICGKFPFIPVFLKGKEGSYEIITVTSKNARWGYELYLAAILTGQESVDAIID